MTASADHFARFVDVLAETLASRLHLSRFHCDRIVSATAGEPPAAMRRRILLERAAYRLLATDEGVLSVALDAGYSSHEAFSRAFSRAYGMPPSRWRRQPTALPIASPSSVHFNPPGGLRVSTNRKVNAVDLLIRMVEHHVWLVEEMVDRAESLPDDVLDAPIEISVEGIDDEPTLRSLLARLVGQLAMWDAAVRGEPYDFDSERHAAILELRSRLAAAGPFFLARVREVAGEGRLDDTFVDAVCDPPEVFTYGGMIAHVLTFAAHRRTLVCGALVGAGVSDLGSGDPMRWVAEAA